MATTSITGPLSIRGMNPPSFGALPEETLIGKEGVNPDHLSISIENPKAEVIATKVSSKAQSSLYDNVYSAFKAWAVIDTVKIVRYGAIAAYANYLPKNEGVNFLSKMEIGADFGSCKSMVKLMKYLGGKDAMSNLFVFTGPLREEVLFRFIVQRILLKVLPQATAKKEDKAYHDSTEAKVKRVLISSAVFSLVHLGNLRVLPPSYVIHQLTGCFMSGIAWGVIQESSKLGILGSIGLHITHNYAAHSFTRLWCNYLRKQ